MSNKIKKEEDERYVEALAKLMEEMAGNPRDYGKRTPGELCTYVKRRME